MYHVFLSVENLDRILFIIHCDQTLLILLTLLTLLALSIKLYFIYQMLSQVTSNYNLHHNI